MKNGAEMSPFSGPYQVLPNQHNAQQQMNNGMQQQTNNIVENTQDTMTLLGKYIDDLDVNLDKTKLKGDISKLYHEAQDLEL